MRVFARHINLLVIAALVLAGVSPACVFISGKSLAEICKSDGSTAEMPVPAELEEFLISKTSDKKTGDEHHADKDCAFCFSQGHLKSALALVALVMAPVSAGKESPPLAFAAAFNNFRSTPFARGPPSLLS